jgi:hypothetical protein
MKKMCLLHERDSASLSRVMTGLNNQLLFILDWTTIY